MILAKKHDVCEFTNQLVREELGVNMAGIEIIWHMRERIQALQAELAQLEQVANRPDTFHS